jgi:serine/threonine protein kinase/tetratricopeptide (TPR) repeat protein
MVIDEKAVFGAALALPAAAEREAYLQDACAGQPELLSRLRELLSAHAESRGPLDRGPAALGVTADAALTEFRGTVIGPYKLLEQIGEGGMGTVFMAEQTEPIQRKVALKIIKAGLDSRQVIARFEAERQALAMMDHVNIARVFDAGATEAGLPYFVMELVHGVPITKYCDDNHLTPRERLELFVPVCQAIQHAHQKGIIHRDIKPSNVMVTLYDGKPVPKVIDFGVAKATEQKLTDRTLFTQYGTMVGTLEYMSPEQAEMSALGVDTRSDIYSLGVLLYELLTGSTPLTHTRMKEGAYAEILRMIREEEAPKPSTRLSDPREALASISANRHMEPAKLSKLMRGELDWIVMKTLEKDRNRRYETANGFAADVQRYLNDETVQACPPSAGYRLRKFVRRNRAAVLTAAAILFVLVAGIAGTTFGFLRAEHRRAEAETARADEAAQRRIADAEKKKAEQAEADTLADYRASTDDAIEQLIGSKPDLGPQEKTYLEKTLKRWQAFAARQGDDERSQAIRAEGHSRVAMLWQKLGQRDAARTEFGTARDLYKKLADAFPDVRQYRKELAGAHNNLGSLLTNLDQHDAARTELETARDLQQKLVAAFPDEPENRRDLATTHNNLAILLARQNQRNAARTEFETARDLQRKLPLVPKYQQDLARTHYNLGTLLAGLNQRDAARIEYETARDLQQKLVVAIPDLPRYQQELARTHTGLGILLAGLGQRDAARTQYETARDLSKKLADAFPAVPQYQVELGGSYCNFGNLVCYEGKPADSLHWYDLAIRTLAPVYEKDRRHEMARQFLRNSHSNRAEAYDQLKKHAEAVKDWDKAVELSSRPEQPSYRAGRANSRLHAGQVAGAVAEVEELTKASKCSAARWYDFACVYAVASGKVADKKQEYAARAMELLRQAVKAGFKDAAHLAKDTDLEPLRGREDFKKLLAELEAMQKE